MTEHLLVANRGEIAIRILRTASDLGRQTTAIYATDDAASLHTRHADQSIDLGGEGVSAYLDIERIIEVAKETGADAIHPGYGFLSESAASGMSGLAQKHSNSLVTRPTRARLQSPATSLCCRVSAEPSQKRRR